MLCRSHADVTLPSIRFHVSPIARRGGSIKSKNLRDWLKTRVLWPFAFKSCSRFNKNLTCTPHASTRPLQFACIIRPVSWPSFQTRPFSIPFLFKLAKKLDNDKHITLHEAAASEQVPLESSTRRELANMLATSALAFSDSSIVWLHMVFKTVIAERGDLVWLRASRTREL